jgi:hypothetical protein
MLTENLAGAIAAWRKIICCQKPTSVFETRNLAVGLLERAGEEVNPFLEPWCGKNSQNGAGISQARNLPRELGT